MQLNGLLKKLPLSALGQLLRIFRFSTRMYEQIQVEYYARLADHSADSPDEEDDIPTEELQPVFVLSTGRCGTKTLAALADLLPDADSHHEPDPKLLEASYLYWMQLCPDAPDVFWQGLLAEGRDELIQQAVRKDKVYFETNNRLALLCRLLIIRYPKAKFIHLVRHPYDFVRSGMRRDYYNDHPWDFVRITPRPDDPIAEGWDSCSQLKKCAWLWTATNAHIDDFFCSIPENRRLFMRSENIFNNVGDSVEKVLSFIADGKNLPNAGKREKVLGMKLNLQTYGNFPKSGDWSPEERKMLQHYCGVLMKKYGYDF
ncbi:MAG: sulfotransferase domain-containing protein [Candidatus Electrothrix scaldis]|nr:MAG: sulfotransferase domain-containing protein [Candidatus Electrothrix sp. GW3-3]